MVSSDWFGGCAAGAGSRVQVGPARGAEAGTLIAAEEQASRSGESQLFPYHRPEVHRTGPFGKRIEIRIVRRLGIGAEHDGVDLEVQLVQDLGETAAAFASDGSVNVPPPEVFAFAGGLQLPLYLHRPRQVELQPREGGITGRKLADGPHGAPVEVPDIDSQHSRLR